MMVDKDTEILVKEIVTYKVMADIRLNRLLVSREKRLNLSEPKPDEEFKLKGKIDAYNCALNIIVIQGLTTKEYVNYVERKIIEELKGEDDV